jgi:hypothetical protein
MSSIWMTSKIRKAFKFMIKVNLMRRYLAMKGYTEDRGHASKLDYDATSRQFVSKPTAHAFQPKPEPQPVLQKLEAGKKQSVEKNASRVTSTWRPRVSAA